VRVAIVEEWLVYGGAARVLEQVLECFPDATLFATIDGLRDDQRGHLRGRTVVESPLRLLPGARRNYRCLLPLMPFAVRAHDLSGYDVILSLNHAVANGARVGPDQLHLSYTHTPMRYAWDMRDDYLRQAGPAKAWIMQPMLERLRRWDARCATKIHQYAANSGYVADRIRRCYDRNATVIYPPVDVHSFSPGDAKSDYYLTVSRLVPYKKLDVIAAAFAGMPDRRLIIVGDGPQQANIAAAASPNVTLLPFLPDARLQCLMREARAFIYAADEDFGIVPVEAQACGTPVIAYGKGGVLESIVGIEQDDPTGLFFGEQSPEAIRDAVKRFEANFKAFNSSTCRNNAMRFSVSRFRHELTDFVYQAWEEFRSRTESREQMMPCPLPGRSELQRHPW
jgi:glycosyltransferase involved in cell wall biosynthesis